VTCRLNREQSFTQPWERSRKDARTKVIIQYRTRCHFLIKAKSSASNSASAAEYFIRAEKFGPKSGILPSNVGICKVSKYSIRVKLVDG
jgi:hypothetical protein